MAKISIKLHERLKSKKHKTGFLSDCAVYLICGIMLLPLYFAVQSAFFSPEEANRAILPALVDGEQYAKWPIFPQFPTLMPLIRLAFNAEFFAMFWNTVFMVAAQLIGQLLVAAPAAWALARLAFRGRGAIYSLYIILMLMPFIVTMVPQYIVLSSLQLIDTMWAVVLPGVFSAMPVFIMTRGFGAVPIELAEAARLDGAGEVSLFIKIALPLGMPSIAAAVMLSFIECYSALETPMLFLKKPSLWPLSLYLTSVDIQNVSLAAAASLVTLVFACLVFFAGQKYLVLGIQSSGIKE